jgi:hypothetical protein
MQTYTSRRNLFGDLCNNSAAVTLSLADKLMNFSEKKIISAKDWDFLERQYTKLTVSGGQAINLPAYTRKPSSVYVTVGSYRYSPKEIVTRSDWDRLNEVVISSDIPTHYMIYDGQLLLYPTPASTGNVVTFNARRVAKDLSMADVTGSAAITTIATTGVTTTITQSGSTWTAAMVGRYIKVTPTDVIATSGDGLWYEIATVPTSSTLTLTRTYQGTALAGGTASYTIGECSLLLEPHDVLPLHEALKIYFTSVEPNKEKADLYDNLLKDGYAQMVRDYGSKVNVVLDDGERYEYPFDPNLHVTL